MEATGEPGKLPGLWTGMKAVFGEPRLRVPEGGCGGVTVQLSEDPVWGNFSLWMVRCKAGVLLCGRKVEGRDKGDASNSRCFSDSPGEAAGVRSPVGVEFTDSLTADSAMGLGTSMPRGLPSVGLGEGTTTWDFWAPLCMTQCKAGMKEIC